MKAEVEMSEGEGPFPANGISSIRYDKCGVGMNQALGSSEADLRFDDYIGDAAAWVGHFKSDDAFTEVAIIGHSEGSLIGMVAAERALTVSFISIVGAERSVDEVLIDQLTAQLPEDLLEEARQIIDQLKGCEKVATVSPELQSVFRPSVQPYMISWLAYDPQEEGGDEAAYSDPDLPLADEFDNKSCPCVRHNSIHTIILHKKTGKIRSS